MKFKAQDESPRAEFRLTMQEQAPLSEFLLTREQALRCVEVLANTFGVDVYGQDDPEMWTRGEIVKTLTGLLQSLGSSTLYLDGTLTSDEAAQLLGITSPLTVQHWLEGGHFPGAQRRPDGSWVYQMRDVLEVLDQMRRDRESGLRKVPEELEGGW